MSNISKKSRAAAIRAQKRSHDDAHRVISRHIDAASKQPKTSLKPIDGEGKLKLTFLGGLEDVGEKNMAVIEYGDDAIILDCGNNLGVDLPGINYEINDTAYLETIRHKIKAYLITHGHLDHIGGLRHTVPKFPAPIYGSRYTIGVVNKIFQDDQQGTDNFQPDLVTVNIDNRERLQVGCFFVEFIRVTHAIPDPAAICIETPVGTIVATGDFRLDPEPLDNLPSDTARLCQLGNEGVLLLLSDSSYADAEGRTPTEHTLQDSFTDIIAKAKGRIFIAVFSSNINRTQMIINAAAEAGRRVALDGRSMLGYVEIAVRQGILKVPKGTVIPMAKAATLPDDKILIMCTGGQGEPNAALGRMSQGQHTYINMGAGDTVIISSSPIPGNEISYDHLSNQLTKKGVQLFRHPTHQLDGCGPLHVSGHAKRDELREMIAMIRPKFFIPVHGGILRRTYHAQLATDAQGMAPHNVLLPHNGDSLYITTDSIKIGQPVPHGSLLVDQNGAVVNGVVVRDRVMLGQQGIVTILLAINAATGQLLKSPDIISRGFISMKDSAPLMKTFRAELHRVIRQRYGRVDMDRLKEDLRDFTVQFMFEHTSCSPMVMAVVTLVGRAKIKSKV